MSERNREKALRRLEAISESSPVELRFRNGERKTIYIYSIEREEPPYLHYASRPPNSDVEYGSKVDPRDWLPAIRFHEIGYIQVQDTKQKISLMAFQEPSPVPGI